ncbi:efflux RND transporter periplasmic adaptor subunit [Celerinatantimonas sp. YJH-8]|uniref:efflux RND transporter periplasmic adaptor subunit n=1 Tax=Celerinatantimonas sp. YJH-8 TaxID=3228714 RepID=UPI0038C449B3
MAKPQLRILTTIVVVIAAILAGYWVWNYYLYSPWTRDGRIRAEVITIAPDVSGWVTQLNIVDNQVVKQGDALFSVDPTRYQAILAQQQANTENRRYTWELSKHRYERRKQLTDKEAISQEDLETARINMALDKANYDLALAQLQSAQIDLRRTQIVAPESGHIINLTLRQGNYVTQGHPVLAIVKKNSYYVTGYFEETKLPLIHMGQKALVTLMSGGQPLPGHVISIGRAIANSNTASNNELLPQVQQTFNWVRLAQRIPVDIKLDSIPEHTILSAGMTVSIHLKD